MGETQSDLVSYYQRRAGEYEAIYSRPERQDDLLLLKKKLAELFRHARVLEVACGTGYWTKVIAATASAVTATDIGEEPMKIAEAKQYARANVRFAVADAYQLEPVLGSFDAAFAGFWWSHIPRQRIAEFVASLHARLEPGARVVMLDNLFVEGNSTALSEVDAHGNTYQLRTLGDGSAFRVLKNYPTKDELRALFPTLHYRALEYYWLAEYRL